jgi:iron complex transport system substrate-binding protein
MTTDQRVISLLPSATEIVAALGFAQNLVGRSHECDFPPGVERLPQCSSTRVSARASSYDIDRQVKQIVADGLSVYDVDVERLRELRPSLILTQTQCAVCAVTPRDLEHALHTWIGAKPVLLSLEPNNLDDVVSDIRRVAEALDDSQRAAHLIASFKGRLDAIREKTAAIESCPSVAVIEWLGPLMSAGNWMPELVKIAGGRPLFGRAGEHSPRLNWTDLIEANPDVILLAPCGFKIAQTVDDLHLLTENAAWPKLRAAANGQVYLIDGHHFFNRPGPRLVESAQMVAEILHPGRFSFGHRGIGWVSLSEGIMTQQEAVTNGSGR